MIGVLVMMICGLMSLAEADFPRNRLTIFMYKVYEVMIPMSMTIVSLYINYMT